MRITIIVAVARNGVIGRNNDLVWRLRDDMQFFSETTRNHAVITGRKNYESIPDRYRPLPNRLNVVITRNPAYQAPGAEVLHSLDEALNRLRSLKIQEAFIIGGGQVYREALVKGNVDRLLVTHVEAEPEGDTFFDLSMLKNGWVARPLGIAFPASERNQHAFEIVEYLPQEP